MAGLLPEHGILFFLIFFNNNAYGDVEIFFCPLKTAKKLASK